MKHTQGLPALKRFVFWLGVGLGSGLAPKAPGTAGSVVALAFLPLMLLLGFELSAGFLVVLSAVGVPICSVTAQVFGVHDDGRIVFDEWAGQALSLLPLVYVAKPLELGAWQLVGFCLLGFALFRFFDVVKPQPIGWLDAKVEGGLGIMLDDLLAGLMAALVLLLCIYAVN